MRSSNATYGDNTCKYQQGGKFERRARKETALRLINPLEYQLAEQTHEGERGGMAIDLSVTLQVIDDYRAILDEQRRLVPLLSRP